MGAVEVFAYECEDQTRLDTHQCINSSHTRLRIEFAWGTQWVMPTLGPDTPAPGYNPEGITPRTALASLSPAQVTLLRAACVGRPLAHPLWVLDPALVRGDGSRTPMGEAVLALADSA